LHCAEKAYFVEKHDLKPLPPVDSAANDLKQTPLWWETAPREGDLGATLPRSADIVIIGAGYTGLSCALALARAGRSVTVIDSGAPGFGASSRSGGMVGHGHRLSYAKLEARYGAPKAKAILREGVAAFDFTIALIERERIDAKFARVGRFRGCATASDYEANAREAERLRSEIGVPCEVVPRAEQHREVASDAYQGGVVFPTHGGLHPGLFHAGLLDVARQAGATVIGHMPALRIDGTKGARRVATARGVVTASEIVVATNGYTPRSIGPLARRLLPIPSFLIATEPVGANRVRAAIPNGRMIVETRSKHLYFRPSPDGQRIILGGRAALHPIALNEAARWLQRELGTILPDLATVQVTHCWTGNVAFTLRELPGIGRHNGIWHALGCNGSGVALMPYLGNKLAQKITGAADGTTAFDDLPLRPIPLYWGDPWFRPLMTAWYRLTDRFESTRLALPVRRSWRSPKG
jgi:glycine/D-amino acid oxidase-like deaminating enzyme